MMQTREDITMSNPPTAIKATIQIGMPLVWHLPPTNSAFEPQVVQLSSEEHSRQNWGHLGQDCPCV
jgi:hypothetical protein